MNKQIRTRYYLNQNSHLKLEDVRQVIINYAFAKNNSGELIISGTTNIPVLSKEFDSTEDAAQIKVIKRILGTSEYIYKQPLSNSEISEAVKQLIDNGSAYYCYCTDEELEQERNQQMSEGQIPHYSNKHRNLTEHERVQYESEGRVPVIRFRVPEDKGYSFDDIVKGKLLCSSKGMGDFIILKRDETPTEIFKTVLSDLSSKITHVVRSELELNNIIKELMLYEALNAVAPSYGHYPLMVKDIKDDIDKHNIEKYLALFNEETIFNFLMLTSINFLDVEDEIKTRKELIDDFDVSNLRKSPPLFDDNLLHGLEDFVYVNKMVDRYLADDIVKLKKTIAECRIAADTDKYYYAIIDILEKRVRRYDQDEVSLHYDNFLNELELTNRRGALVQALYDHPIKATILFEED